MSEMRADARAAGGEDRGAPVVVRARAPREGLFTIRHIWIWLAVVAGAIIVATAGYVLLLGWAVDDAIYMTIITLTTVGFKEVRDLSDVGRVWTMLVAITGVGLIFGTVGIVSEELVREVTSGAREVRRMKSTIDALTGHYVLCGYGRVGRTVARELQHDGMPVVVIDDTPEAVELARHDGHLLIQGDATEDETLRAAGIERARGLITAIESDALNVYVILSARAINPELFVVARANAADSEAKLLRAGADRAVSPYGMAGHRLAELASRPRVVDFIDLALSHGEHAFSLEEIEVSQKGPLDGRTVADLRTEGIFVLAIAREGKKKFEANPSDDRQLCCGETLIVSGTAATLRELADRP